MTVTADTTLLSDKLRNQILTAYQATQVELPPDTSPEDIRAGITWVKSPRMEALLLHSEFVETFKYVDAVPVDKINLKFSSKNRPRLEGPFSNTTLNSLLASAREGVILEPAIAEDLNDGEAGLLDYNTRLVFGTLGRVYTHPAYIVKLKGDTAAEIADSRYILVATLNQMLNGTPEEANIVLTRCVQFCLERDLRGDDDIRDVARAKFRCKYWQTVRDRVVAELARQALRDHVKFTIGTDYGLAADAANENSSVAESGGLSTGVMLHITKIYSRKVKVKLAELAFEYDLTISNVGDIVNSIEMSCGKGDTMDREKALAILDKAAADYADIVEEEEEEGVVNTGTKHKGKKKAGIDPDDSPIERSTFEKMRTHVRNLASYLAAQKNYNMRKFFRRMSRCRTMIKLLRSLQKPIELTVKKFDAKYNPDTSNQPKKKAKP